MDHVLIQIVADDQGAVRLEYLADLVLQTGRPGPGEHRTAPAVGV